jgi:hypothetical protein
MNRCHSDSRGQRPRDIAASTVPRPNERRARIHTHAARSKEGPPLALQDGGTGWVDAGSAGADNIDEMAAVARGAPQIGRLLVNIARTG